jgi:hypothetical protein
MVCVEDIQTRILAVPSNTRECLSSIAAGGLLLDVVLPASCLLATRAMRVDPVRVVGAVE